MCGLNGIYAYHDAASPIDSAELLRTRDHMVARGPDGEGEWTSADRRVGFGHRRLSIIDLTSAGAQPMANAENTLIVTFNGEIYNHRELRRDLEAKGYVFRSNSDTEVLLHLYAEKQESMVLDLRGMFAFAIWDSSRRRLFMARDPYGIKPLYYSDDGKTLRFASQVKALLAGGGVSTETDAAGIVGFYLFGSVPEPFTSHRHIHALQAGHFLTVAAGRTAAPRQYHSIAAIYADAEKAKSHQIAPEGRQVAIREALLDSVRHHLVSDVPVGAFLSAGIDSGALVGLMRDAGQSEIETVTLSFKEFEGSPNDEAPIAALVARTYGTHHHTRVVTKAEFKAELPRILAAMDQPSIDGINSWFVSKAAHELGLKVAVSGLGGDELFGGYPSFKDIPRWVRWLKAPSAVPGLGALIRHAVIALGPHRLGLSPKLAGLIQYGGNYAGAWYLRRGLYMPWELTDQLAPDLVSEGLARLEPIEQIEQALRPEPQQAFNRVATMEAALYMRNQLLRDTDWASMAHSLEVRTPLVDAHLLKRVAALGGPEPNMPAKGVLLAAPSVPLPNAVIERNKTGFAVPVERWRLGAQESMTSKPFAYSRDWAGYVAVKCFNNQAPSTSNDWEPTTQAFQPLKEKLRVLMLATDAHGGYGGIAQYNRDVIDAICGLDSVAEVVVLPRLMPESGFAHPAKSTYDLAGASSAKSFVTRSVVHAVGRYDFIYCAHINLLPVASMLARIRGVPLVLAIYGIDAWQRPESKIRGLGMSAVSLVVSISQVTLDRFRAWSGFPIDKCALMPNAIRQADFAIGTKENALAHCLGVAARPVILTFGRMVSFERYKGFDEVINAMPQLVKRIPDLVYVAAGDGNDRQRLEAKVEALGLGENVKFTGRVSEAEKADLYRLADAYVMPSTGEGFGFVVLEALACGIPVVASTADGTREAVRDGELGLLVDPKDLGALVEAIFEALARPKLILPGLEYFSFNNFEKRLATALARVVPIQI